MLYQKIFSKEYLMNFLLLAIPISYILGNLVLNINIIILIVTSLVFALASKKRFFLFEFVAPFLIMVGIEHYECEETEEGTRTKANSQ